MSELGPIFGIALFFILYCVAALPFVAWRERAVARLEESLAPLADQAGLGAERGRYQTSTTEIASLMAKTVPGGIGGFLIAFGVLFAGDYFDFGVIGWSLIAPVGVVGVIIALIPPALAVVAAGNQFRLFDAGLVHLHPTTGARVFRWAEAELYGTVKQHVKAYGSELDQRLRIDPRIKVRDSRGAQVEIEADTAAIAHAIELISAIQDNITRHRLPRAIRDITEGHSVEFGPIVVDQHGVTLEGRTTSWANVSGFRYIGAVGFGFIQLVDSGGEAGSELANTDDIPNLAVLVQLTAATRDRG